MKKSRKTAWNHSAPAHSLRGPACISAATPTSGVSAVEGRSHGAGTEATPYPFDFRYASLFWSFVPGGHLDELGIEARHHLHQIALIRHDPFDVLVGHRDLVEASRNKNHIVLV